MEVRENAPLQLEGTLRPSGRGSRCRLERCVSPPRSSRRKLVMPGMASILRCKPKERRGTPGDGTRDRARVACGTTMGGERYGDARAVGTRGLLAAGVQASGYWARTGQSRRARGRTGRLRATSRADVRPEGLRRARASRPGEAKRARARPAQSWRRSRRHGYGRRRARGLASPGGCAVTGILRGAEDDVALLLTDSLQVGKLQSEGSRTEGRGSSKWRTARRRGRSRGGSSGVEVDAGALRSNLKSCRHRVSRNASSWHAVRTNRGCEDGCNIWVDRDRQIRMRSAHAHAALTRGGQSAGSALARGEKASIHHEHAHDEYLLNNVMTKRTCSEKAEHVRELVGPTGTASTSVSLSVCSLKTPI